VVLLVVGIVFRSILIPLRSVLTLSMTVAFVFGMASLVYNYGAFDFLGWNSLHSSEGITWLIPVVCFSIVVGLSLDYDLLLLFRIDELRATGYNTQNAIRKAQFKTGPVISVAGVIMAVAFSGLLLSSSTALNQMGFILSVSVLFDTFVLRAFFVPSVMSIFGNANFWPKKYPPVEKDLPVPKNWHCCHKCKKRSKYREIN
jgi:uncharacterized membrane protein YdfJ with MMPL/SSD domain